MSRRKEREHSSGADYGADSTRLQQRRSRGLSESGRLDDQQTTGARKEREKREDGTIQQPKGARTGLSDHNQ